MSFFVAKEYVGFYFHVALTLTSDAIFIRGDAHVSLAAAKSKGMIAVYSSKAHKIGINQKMIVGFNRFTQFIELKKQILTDIKPL